MKPKNDNDIVTFYLVSGIWLALLGDQEESETYLNLAVKFFRHRHVVSYAN